jgi:hypothetical protein
MSWDWINAENRSLALSQLTQEAKNKKCPNCPDSEIVPYFEDPEKQVRPSGLICLTCKETL